MGGSTVDEMQWEKDGKGSARSSGLYNTVLVHSHGVVSILALKFRMNEVSEIARLYRQRDSHHEPREEERRNPRILLL